GTVDCTITQRPTAAEPGLLEVATHVAYTSEENSLSGRSAGANLAGIGYQNLPLAYQQIIFDSQMSGFASSNAVIAEGNARALEQLRESGGEIEPLDEDADQRIGATTEQRQAAVEEAGLRGSSAAARP